MKKHKARENATDNARKSARRFWAKMLQLLLSKMANLNSMFSSAGSPMPMDIFVT
jgi:hypothetical protein